MNTSRKALTTAAAVASGLAIVGGAAAANAAGIARATLAPAATSTPSPDAAEGTQDPGRCGPHGHTAVTGAELTKVTDAVKAKDAGVSVQRVEKDPDGSYDVHATKDGARLRYEVSADLATITEAPRGPGERRMGTEVTGAEATKVGDAVKAKNPGVSIEHVMKKDDGSYHVGATKDGSRVMFHVSSDLATITQDTRGPGRGKGMRGGEGQGRPGPATPSGSPSASSTSPSASPSSGA